MGNVTIYYNMIRIQNKLCQGQRPGFDVRTFTMYFSVLEIRHHHIIIIGITYHNNIHE